MRRSRKNLRFALLMGIVACAEVGVNLPPGPGICTNAAAAITAPAADAVFTVYQGIQLTGTGGSSGCDALLVWYVDLVPVPALPGHTSVSYGAASGQAISPGHATITLEVKNGIGQVLSQAQRQIWVVLPRELLYDVGEATIWRTDAHYNTQVTTGGNPAWASDRNRIAFQRDDATDAEIWVINRDGSGEQQITDNTVDDYAPSWSPDGGRLVYARQVSGSAELAVQAATPGLNPTLLTQNPFDDNSPHWFGNLILYHADAGGTTNIYTLRGDLPPFQAPVLIPNTTNGVDPRWSMDGSQFVFSLPRAGSTDHDVVRINANGSNPTVLTVLMTGSNNREPDIAPDGVVAFVSNAGGTNRIWIRSANSLSLPLLVRGLPAGARHPRWRP